MSAKVSSESIVFQIEGAGNFCTLFVIHQVVEVAFYWHIPRKYHTSHYFSVFIQFSSQECHQVYS